MNIVSFVAKNQCHLLNISAFYLRKGYESVLLTELLYTMYPYFWVQNANTVASSGGRCYLQGLAASLCRHAPPVFTSFPPLKLAQRLWKEQKQEWRTLRCDMWPALAAQLVSWHFTIHSGDERLCVTQRKEKPQPLGASPKHALPFNAGILMSWFQPFNFDLNGPAQFNGH